MWRITILAETLRVFADDADIRKAIYGALKREEQERYERLLAESPRAAWAMRESSVVTITSVS